MSLALPRLWNQPKMKSWSGDPTVEWERSDLKIIEINFFLLSLTKWNSHCRQTMVLNLLSLTFNYQTVSFHAKRTHKKPKNFSFCFPQLFHFVIVRPFFFWLSQYYASQRTLQATSSHKLAKKTSNISFNEQLIFFSLSRFLSRDPTKHLC